MKGPYTTEINILKFNQISWSLCIYFLLEMIKNTFHNVRNFTFCKKTNTLNLLLSLHLKFSR